ncbi:MAG TPA: type II secretion system F family protein [Candidatus Saccharimonadales bacterium]|nr:type II secretion system F family protein [Candidatus Saccharimonadales bacterium]
MLSFTYEARDVKTGNMVSAEIEAESEAAAARLLTERGLSPLEIVPSKDKAAKESFLNRLPSKQKVVFSRQLSTLVNAGLPLVQSLNTVRSQTANKRLKFIIGRIVSDVEAGSSLAEAMSRHPKVFGEVYTSLIAAGEASGMLDASLERLANQEEKDAEMVSKLRGAMIYPLIVVIVLLGVVTFLLTSVLPQVESLYAGLPGAKLPFVTQALLAVAHFVIGFWWIILLVLATGITLSVRWVRTPPGRLFLDGFKMRTWGIGPLFMKVYMARFARTSATLVSSGVPLLQMLNTTAKAIGNVHIQAAVMQATEQVRGGKALSASLSGDRNFLELVPNMIHIGEQSGALGDMLAKLADYYEKEVDNQIKSISTVIEPVLMVTVGIIALIVVAAVLLPIYTLAGKNFLSP